MNQRHNHGPFSCACCDTLHGTTANISCGEHSRRTGTVVIAEDVPLVIQVAVSLEPLCTRCGTDEYEHALHGNAEVCSIVYSHRAQFLITHNCGDLGLRQDHDVRGLRDAFLQVCTHTSRQPFATHNHAHLLGVLCEEHCSLTCAVGSSDDGHALTGVRLGGGHVESIEYSFVYELVNAWGVHLTPLQAIGQQQCTAR